MTTYSVTVEGFGRVSTREIEANSPEEAEQLALEAVGIVVQARRQAIQYVNDERVYVDPSHDCDLDESSLVYDGHVGAPGIGIAFHCATCGRHWLKIGSSFVDPSTGPYELSPEDVR